MAERSSDQLLTICPSPTPQKRSVGERASNIYYFIFSFSFLREYYGAWRPLGIFLLLTFLSWFPGLSDFFILLFFERNQLAKPRETIWRKKSQKKKIPLLGPLSLPDAILCWLRRLGIAFLFLSDPKTETKSAGGPRIASSESQGKINVSEGPALGPCTLSFPRNIWWTLTDSVHILVPHGHIL